MTNSGSSEQKHSSTAARNISFNLLQNKTVLILGLGLHGGGLSSADFAAKQQAKQILLSDSAHKEKFLPLHNRFSEFPANSKFEFGGHSRHFVDIADCIIKNPAIAHRAPIIQYALEKDKQIETDISLYLRYSAMPENRVTLTMVTGTKGKSSICTAIHALHMRKKERNSSPLHPPSALTGNIGYSPLNLIDNGIYPQHIVCELSAQQGGDLQLAQRVPTHTLKLLVFSNFMRDHLNYYGSMEEYFENKAYIFKRAAGHCKIVVPDDSWGQRLAVYSKPSQRVWHSSSVLVPNKRGAWFSNNRLCYRTEIGGEVQCLHGKVPYSYLAQNMLIIMAYCIACKMDFPQSREEWQHCFTLAHRKEKLGTLDGRVFINDTAATIPQAMQLGSLESRHIRLICGGSDKNLAPEDMVTECKLAEHCYLLEGTYSSQVLPLLKQAGIPCSGPFVSMKEALYAAYEDSQSADTIILSPGCASFGMFLHEFDRGEQFRTLVRQLMAQEKKTGV